MSAVEYEAALRSGIIQTETEFEDLKSAVKVITAWERLAAGDLGEDVTFYSSVAAQVARIRHGTTAAPNKTPGPTVRVSRTEALTRAQIEAIGGAGTDGGEQCAAIIGLNSGTAATEVQSVGVYGAAKNVSTLHTQADACGIYGAGRSLSGCTGAGFGGFFIGRRDSSSGRATGIEVHTYNDGAADSYVSTGANSTKGMWINCGGAADSAAGILFGQTTGRQWDVGIAFNAQVNGVTGGVKTASIRDDSTAITTLDVRGSHTYGIDFHNATALTSGAIRLKNQAKVLGRDAANSADHELFRYDEFDILRLGTGAAAMWAQQNLTFADAKNIILNATTGSKIGTATTQKLGFWNATPVVRPAGWGAPTGTATRTTFATSTVTLPQLAERVKALLDDLTTVGLIGA